MIYVTLLGVNISGLSCGDNNSACKAFKECSQLSNIGDSASMSLPAMHRKLVLEFFLKCHLFL